MEIKLEDNQKNGLVTALEGNATAGELTFTWAGTDKFIIDHTHVNEGFNGQGIGRKLVDKAIDYAKEKNAKIMPLCPYAKSVFDKDPNLKSILF